MTTASVSWSACRRLAPIALALLLAGRSGLAQETDLTLPPRIEETGPGVARLEPRVDEQAVPLEEVVVVGAAEWRLPDLGSEWRAQEEEREDPGRIEVSFLPLYDPANEDPYVDMFPRRLEEQRVGFIEIFRVRFGGRDRDD